MRRVVSASDLMLSNTPHFDWKCIGCGLAVMVEAVSRAPRCGRCGDWCAPVHAQSGVKCKPVASG